MITIFILIYLMSFLVHIVLCYKNNKRHIFYMRDLLDEIEFYMWFPVLNTLMLLLVIIAVIIMKLWEITKLDVLWEKFKNIRLR